MNRSPQVVITGLGVVAPNGIGVEPFWRSLLDGRSGIGPITLFDASQLKCRIGGEVRGFDLANFFEEPRKLKRQARHTQLALAACKLALEDARFDVRSVAENNPLPIAMGISVSAIDVIERGVVDMVAKGPAGVSPLVVPTCNPQAVASCLSEALRVPTRDVTFSTACTAGLYAIAAAAQMIRAGHAEAIVAGGADSPINRFTFATFEACGLVSSNNEDPARASRPFDLERKSGIASEGAGVVVIESLAHALARGARPYATIAGFGASMDSQNDKPGSGLRESMRQALANAGRNVNDVDYICAHGSGDPVLDRIETRTIAQVFGRRAYSIPVSSIKGATGNPLAAGGPMQVIASSLAIHQQLIPPTTNYERPDPECDLDYVPGSPRMSPLASVLVNSHGIGGINGSLLLERIEGP